MTKYLAFLALTIAYTGAKAMYIGAVYLVVLAGKLLYTPCCLFVYMYRPSQPADSKQCKLHYFVLSVWQRSVAFMVVALTVLLVSAGNFPFCRLHHFLLSVRQRSVAFMFALTLLILSAGNFPFM
jgi:hypothetical protein